MQTEKARPIIVGFSDRNVFDYTLTNTTRSLFSFIKVITLDVQGSNWVIN